MILKEVEKRDHISNHIDFATQSIMEKIMKMVHLGCSTHIPTDGQTDISTSDEDINDDEEN